MGRGQKSSVFQLQPAGPEGVAAGGVTLARCQASAAMGLLTIAPLTLSPHLKECKKGSESCTKCAWAKFGSRWEAKHGMPGSPHPWLAAAYNEDQQRFGVGCVACARAASGGNRSEYSDFRLQPTQGYNTSHFNRHENTIGHKKAVESYVCKSTVIDFAPPLEEFQACLGKLEAGRSMRDKAGPSDKSILVRWCVTEAILEQSRGDLEKCITLVLLRDERHGRLLLRYRGCKPDLTVASGTLGLAKMASQTAEDILAATKKSLVAFCTPRRCPPRAANAVGPPANDASIKSLFDDIRNKVEVVVTDAAASEKLAQEFGRGKRVAVDGKVVMPFPSVKLIGRDRAHACGRLREGERERGEESDSGSHRERRRGIALASHLSWAGSWSALGGPTLCSIPWPRRPSPARRACARRSGTLQC